MIRQVVAAACLALTALPAFAADNGLLLRKDDRVVFYGDSITQQRLYTRYVQQYVYVRYPDLNVRFFNAGWGGDTAKGANARLERDVLHLDPTVVTLCFGMNDGRYRAQDDAIAEGYEREMDALVSRLVDAGIRVLVASPGCVDTERRPQLAEVDYNGALANLAEVAARVARKHDCRYVDLHTPMLRVQTEQKKQNPDFTMIPDAVHPAPAGHLVMAHAILKGLGVERLRPLGEWTAESDGLSVEGALPTPFWIDGKGTSVARACGLLSDLAAQELKIDGLASGEYEVAVGGRPVGKFPGAELGRGIRVGGSWAERGREIHDALVDLENGYFDLWRTWRLPRLGRQSSPAVADAESNVLRARMAALDAMHELIIATCAAPDPQRLTVERAPSGPNLALGKSYESSDSNPHSWGVGGLTDGSWAADAQDCFATGSSAAFPKHVTVDLGRVQRIALIRFGVPEFGSTRTVGVSISRNGTSFTDVGEHTFGQNAAERSTLRFEPTPARHVRLTYEDHHPRQVGYSTTFAFTTELEVYGP